MTSFVLAFTLFVLGAAVACGAAFLYFGSYWFELLNSDDPWDNIFDDLDEFDDSKDMWG